MPFTPEQFFEVFSRYNNAVWPAQLALYALGVIAILLAIGDGTRRGQMGAAILAFLWLWVAIVYHLAFFRAINPAAGIFAALFAIQALLFIWLGVWQRRFVLRVHWDGYAAAGSLILVYALVAYPVLGYLLGQRYPAIPTFGLPCPTTIFTFGMLLWAQRPIPRVLLIIPGLWALLGIQAALQLGVREDFGLTAAALITIPLLVYHASPARA